MASNTASSENRRKNRHSNMGRKRKNQDARKSTPSATELFAALGEPGKPAPGLKGTAAKAKPAAKPAAAAKPKAAAKPAAAK